MVEADDLKQLSSGDFLASAHGAISKAIYSALEYRSDTNWLPKIAEELEPALHSALRSLAATELPARNEQELEKYVAGVVNAGFIALLTRQKLSMQAVLRQLDPAETAKIEQIQRELISIEERRRKLQGG
jgi:DNA primase